MGTKICCKEPANKDCLPLSSLDRTTCLWHLSEGDQVNSLLMWTQLKTSPDEDNLPLHESFILSSVMSVSKILSFMFFIAKCKRMPRRMSARGWRTDTRRATSPERVSSSPVVWFQLICKMHFPVCRQILHKAKSFFFFGMLMRDVPAREQRWRNCSFWTNPLCVRGFFSGFKDRIELCCCWSMGNRGQNGFVFARLNTHMYKLATALIRCRDDMSRACFWGPVW